ncbi:MAG: AAA domain-containing protein [Victivallaceae bacterium]|nr:AAA domain-containing protein [Victivallaceae bacterium]
MENIGIDQICYYFEEGLRQWEKNPNYVMSREFYELWEATVKAMPFKIADATIELFEYSFPLIESAGERIGRFCWLHDEECAGLIIESPECIERFLLCFSDGHPTIYETEPSFHEALELSHGERLEVVSEVIAYALKHRHDINVLKMTKKDFLDLLDNIAAHYDKLTIRAIRCLNAYAIKTLIGKATEDIPDDELTGQLTLALGGSHIAPIESEADVIQSSQGRQKKYVTDIPQQTIWSVVCEADFLNRTCRILADFEKGYIIRFNNFAVINSFDSGDLAIKLSFKSQVVIREGDMLGFYKRGVSEQLGTFKAELFDKDALYGSLRSDTAPEELSEEYYLVPRRSPSEFIAKSIDKLVDFMHNRASQMSDAVAASFGLRGTTCTHHIAEEAPEMLDDSQKTAWTAAVNTNNPVVLIQGPPGTGKTSVIAKIVETMSRRGNRILVAAPSNTAVDNICRRLNGLPVLRIGKNIGSIAPDIAEKYWEGDLKNLTNFVTIAREQKLGEVFAGTPVGLLRSNILWEELKERGQFDVLILDEAGMARVAEYLLLCEKCGRSVLVGDHRQLPPFPLPDEVISTLNAGETPVPASYWRIAKQSALEWLAEQHDFPLALLKFSYRCQNPRLLRFCSILFYDASVKISPSADYYTLGYHERLEAYPRSTLRLYSTSTLPEVIKAETLCFEGSRPGLENLLEAKLCVALFYDLVEQYSYNEITIIAPYRRQVMLIRELLAYDKLQLDKMPVVPDEKSWENFLFSRIATVDSFQGNESDVVVTCYVRSNQEQGIGFVNAPNRINVAHTRCRREMIVIGDIECLKHQEEGNIFKRMERAIERDGQVIQINHLTATAILNDEAVALELATPVPILDPAVPKPIIPKKTAVAPVVKPKPKPQILPRDAEWEQPTLF